MSRFVIISRSVLPLCSLGDTNGADNDVTEVKINFDDDTQPLLECDKNARR